MFYVYIFVSQADGSLYTGQTDDLRGRFEKHNKGLVKSTKSKAPFDLGYVEEFGSRRDAMWREWELKKKYNTGRKKKLIGEFDHNKIQLILGL